VVAWFDDRHRLAPRLESRYLRAQEGVRGRTERGVFKRQDGQGMVEYALILVLIAIVVILILSTVGKQVKNVFSNVSNGLGS
jgi:pilus assembly protein Flp/PilA